VDPVPDPLLLRKSGSAGNQTRELWICSQEVGPLDHRGSRIVSRASLNVAVKKKILNADENRTTATRSVIIHGLVRSRTKATELVS
jgi:hypothetical protein